MGIPELGAISDMLLNSTAPTDIQENMSECESEGVIDYRDYLELDLTYIP